MTGRRGLAAALVGVLLLACCSTLVGVNDLSAWELITEGDARDLQVMWISRIPRAVALVLSGSSLAIAGLIMQMLARNKFVGPSTAGTAESAALGVLVVLLLGPELPILAKMVVATGFAIAGTALFLTILGRVPMRSPLMVPLVGMVLGGIVQSITTFFAYRYNLLQSLTAWTTADFSSVLRGRYELLWVTGGLTVAAYFAADRLTAASVGKAFATNLGINHKKVVRLGLIVVSVVTAAVVVSAGMIPFIGLIVPNLVSLWIGDNARRSLPWVGLIGAAFVLSCDIIGRLIRFPFEVPVGTIAGVVGSAAFLVLVLRRRTRDA